MISLRVLPKSVRCISRSVILSRIVGVLRQCHQHQPEHISRSRVVVPTNSDYGSCVLEDEGANSVREIQSAKKRRHVDPRSFYQASIVERRSFLLELDTAHGTLTFRIGDVFHTSDGHARNISIQQLLDRALAADAVASCRSFGTSSVTSAVCMGSLRQ